MRFKTTVQPYHRHAPVMIVSMKLPSKYVQHVISLVSIVMVLP